VAPPTIGSDLVLLHLSFHILLLNVNKTDFSNSF
jgi:hypothetical protein